MDIDTDTFFLLATAVCYLVWTFVLACMLSWEAGKHPDPELTVYEDGVKAGDIFRVQLKFAWKVLTLPFAIFKSMRKAKA